MSVRWVYGGVSGFVRRAEAAPCRLGRNSDLTNALYFRPFIPNDIYLYVPESSVAYQYVDEGAFMDPWLGIRPWIESPLS